MEVSEGTKFKSLLKSLFFPIECCFCHLENDDCFMTKTIFSKQTYAHYSCIPLVFIYKSEFTFY